MKPCTATILFLPLLLLAACSVGPDYVRPQAPVPPAFKEVAGWKVAQPGGDRLAPEWWRLFNDPQLSALVEKVQVDNQNLAAAEARVRQAKALVRQTKAGYYPTLGVGASVTRSDRGRLGASGTDTTGTGTGSSGSGRSSNTLYSLPIDLSWEADLWGRIRRSVEASQERVQASEDDLAAARLSAQAELANNYFQLRNQDAQKALLDATVASYQKALELTRNRYQGGVAARSDLLQAETQLKTAQAQAIDLQVQRAQLEHAIALLTGQPASGFSLPPAPLAQTLPAIPVGLPSELLERRPDIAAAERRMAAANADIGVAQAAYYPRLSLSASAGFEAASPAGWFTWPSRFWALGPAISQTLFDGGLRRGQNEQARAAYDETVASYRNTVLTAFQEVEDNLAELRILEQEAAALDEALKAARESLAVTLNQYRAGLVSYLNVIVAQNSALANERSAVAVQARRLSASVLLVKALGGGWQGGAAR